MLVQPRFQRVCILPCGVLPPEIRQTFTDGCQYDLSTEARWYNDMLQLNTSSIIYVFNGNYD